jgi:hypothetical protein
MGVALTFGGASAANAAQATVQQSPTSTQEAEPASTQAQLDDMEAALSLLERIPDSVLHAGDEATQQWVGDNAPTASGDGVALRASVLGCAAAIATVVASTAFPAAKILKAKALIKQLGGVTEAAKIMWGASFSFEKMKALGGASAALAGELIGITQIKEQCFS